MHCTRLLLPTLKESKVSLERGGERERDNLCPHYPKLIAKCGVQAGNTERLKQGIESQAAPHGWWDMGQACGREAEPRSFGE